MKRYHLNICLETLCLRPLPVPGCRNSKIGGVECESEADLSISQSGWLERKPLLPASYQNQAGQIVMDRSQKKEGPPMVDDIVYRIHK